MPDEFSDSTMRTIVQAFYDAEQGDRLLEWGAKLFYFDRRKCIQICNFASKFTVILVDAKMKDLESVGDTIAQYMMDIYTDDKKMTALLERFFKDHPLVCFAKLTDRSIISSLNHLQSQYLEDGYRLYDFIKDNVLQTKELNRKINRDYIATEKVNGKTQYFFPAEKFAELLKKRYAGHGHLLRVGQKNE
ncbi:MAG: hypothetical protein LUI61_01920 [Firmicutes bacterium]|nr:hypothetical protein [Bacillota bacterium]